MDVFRNTSIATVPLELNRFIYQVKHHFVVKVKARGSKALLESFPLGCSCHTIDC